MLASLMLNSLSVLSCEEVRGVTHSHKISIGLAQITPVYTHIFNPSSKIVLRGLFGGFVLFLFYIIQTILMNEKKIQSMFRPFA